MRRERRFERPSAASGDTEGLRHETPELLVDGASRVRLEVHVSSLVPAGQDPSPVQTPELAPDVAVAQSRAPHQVSDVEGALRVSEEHPQDVPAGGREKRVSDPLRGVI
jgi:hypothetical protein